MVKLSKCKIEINKQELLSMLRTYFTDEVESCPGNAEAFCNVFFEKFGSESNRQNNPRSDRSPPEKHQELMGKLSNLNSMERGKAALVVTEILEYLMDQMFSGECDEKSRRS